VVRAASQGLRSFPDALRGVGVEIKPANVRQDFFIAMASREFAKAARFVVDAKFKGVIRDRRDEIVDEIFRKLLSTAFCSLDGLLRPGPGPIPACMPKCCRSRPALEPTKRPRWWLGAASPAAANSSGRGRSWQRTES
jgi:hypothetical protein